MNIEIRRAELSDIEEMSAVVDSAWRENYRDIFTKEIIDQFTGKHRRESFARLIDCGTDIRVLTVDRRMAALCAFRALEERYRSAEVILMYVHPDLQRRGYGERLLSNVLETLRDIGCSFVTLDTAEKNGGARRFYEKHGFTLLDQRENGISYVTYGKKL